MNHTEVRTLPYYMRDWRIGAMETLMGMCILKCGAAERRVVVLMPQGRYL